MDSGNHSNHSHSQPHSQPKPPKLTLHEWSIVILFCLILLTITGFAIGRSKSSPPVVKSLRNLHEITALQVNIEGEVGKPGFYRLPLDATLNDLLIQAEPFASADLSELNWRRKLRDNERIYIPARHLITIQLKGAVEEPGSMEILSGTRYCHLVDLLPLLPNADVKGMRKRRSFVFEGDCVEVPASKIVKKKERVNVGKKEKSSVDYTRK